MTSELVDPVGTITFGPFGEAGRAAYTPPRNTLDPRYAACTSHHVACDCREAEWAEVTAEHRLDQQERQVAADTILAGHPTYSATPCQCTGCQLARAIHIYPKGSLR